MAKVDHRWSGMMHTFIIVRGGLIYQISLPESVITVRAQHELKRMVQPVLDRAQLGAAPRRVLVRSMSSTTSGNTRRALKSESYCPVLGNIELLQFPVATSSGHKTANRHVVLTP